MTGAGVDANRNSIKSELKKLEEDDLKELKNKMKSPLNENALSTFLSLQGFFQELDENRNDDKSTWTLERTLFNFFREHLLENNNKDNINECLKYVFSGCENNCFLAMIIMEEFILLDEQIIGKKKVGKDYIMVDSSKLYDKDNCLLEISREIQLALNWDNVDKRKKIIKNLFSFIPKINELMCECDRIAVEKGSINHRSRFIALINIYKSFLNKILLLYPDDIEKDDVKKIPVYFLDDKEVIKLFCRICGDRVDIDCFSEIIVSVNSEEYTESDISNEFYPERMYKFKKANSILKILGVIDSIEEIKKESSNLDPDNSISDFIIDIKTTALLICFGYPEEQPGTSVETHLDQYDENGKFSYKHSDSVLRDMFKSLCKKKITTDEFLKKYGYQLDENRKTQLGKIIDSKENTDNFNSFEGLVLPLIEQDYKDKKMNFVDFVQKYDLLKNAIGVKSIDKRMINIAYDCVGEKLSFTEFIYKYYVLPKNENKIIDPKIDDYHIKELEDETSQNILTEVLINGKDTKK